MNTKMLTQADILPAAKIIQAGGLLAIPTETVYGLGADGLNPTAVLHIFEAKGRPQDNPLILHIPSADWLERYCTEIPPAAAVLAARFWPGPLTMILRRRPNVPDVVTGGLDTVGMRCPDHGVTRAIIQAAGVPIAAPSANTSGRPSPTTAAHVLADMDGKIDGIVDGGPCAVGVESTIIDLTLTPPRLLRPGGITLEQLRQVLGQVDVDEAVSRILGKEEKPRAPGMKYRHYAPKAPVTVVKGDPAACAHYIAAQVDRDSGVLCFGEFAPLFDKQICFTLGSYQDKAEQARHVFDALRAFDNTPVTAIWAQCPDTDGLGLAVANRLNKAAGFHIIDLHQAGNTVKRIGITGPTGAGKTTALHALIALGGHIIDCDAVYHALLASNQALKEALLARFGAICDEAGQVDRKKLGAIVFQQEAALADLDAITHRFVTAEIQRQCDQAQARGCTAVGIDAIGLIESGVGAQCDAVVGVLAPAQVRIRRIMAREGISEDYARMRVEAQKGEAFFRANCTDILENHEKDTADSFEQKARSLFETILKRKREDTEGAHGDGAKPIN